MQRDILFTIPKKKTLSANLSVYPPATRYVESNDGITVNWEVSACGLVNVRLSRHLPVGIEEKLHNRQ
jgi:hypothetical protein